MATKTNIVHLLDCFILILFFVSFFDGKEATFCILCLNGKTVLIEELNSTAIDFICFVNYLVNLTPICFRFFYREIQIQLFFFGIVKKLLNDTILILFIWFVNLTLLCKSSWTSLNFLSILQNDQGCETQGTGNVKGGINHYSW